MTTQTTSPRPPEQARKTIRAASWSLLIVVSLTVSVLVSGCGSHPAAYAPAAYGVPGHCYYVDDQAEAIALRHAGLCPSSWTPTVMPLLWHQRYYSYYDSPAYYTHYVPARSRTVFVHQQASFGHTYHTAIAAQSKTATYRSSKGGTVSGAKVGTVHFGSGTSFGSTGQKYGGGGLRGGSGAHSGGGGHGGGGR